MPTLRDLEIRLGEVSYIQNGVWKTRPATDEDIRIYNRDCLIQAIQDALLSSGDIVNALPGNKIDYARLEVKGMCYDYSEDLGMLYDAVAPLCHNAASVFLENNAGRVLVEKCTEFNRGDLIAQYNHVRREVSGKLEGGAFLFADYVNRLVDVLGFQEDSGIPILANSLGRFPLFYALERCLSVIEPELADVAKSKLCIYGNNDSLTEEEIIGVSRFYSKIKYRIDSFIRKIQDIIEPLDVYRFMDVNDINSSERTNFSVSFHHYICFRLIPNTHYYGVLRPRIPDWVFVPKGREIYYANKLFCTGVRRVLEEANKPALSRAMIIDNCDIRFCFDDYRYNLIYGESFGFALSDFHKITAEEALDRFKNSSSEGIVIPNAVIEECNRMLQILGAGKRIDNYILTSCSI